MGDSGKANLHARRAAADATSTNSQTSSQGNSEIDLSWPLYSPDSQVLQNHHLAALTSHHDYGQSSTAPKLTPEKKARKRFNDRVYREKQKRGKEEMKYNLDTLTRENGDLNHENSSLKLVHENMKSTLESQAKVIAKLEYDLQQLRSGYASQTLLIQFLSENVENHPDLRAENQKLEIENELLKQVVYASDDQKKCPLVEEMKKLKVENRRLKVQNNALCHKLISLSARNVDGQHDKADP